MSTSKRAAPWAQSCNLIRLPRHEERQHRHRALLSVLLTQSAPRKCTTRKRPRIRLICSSHRRTSVRQVRQAWAIGFGRMRTNLACMMITQRLKTKYASHKVANVTSNLSSQPCLDLQKASIASKQGIKPSVKQVKMTILQGKRAILWTKPFLLTSIRFLVPILPAVLPKTNSILGSKNDSTRRPTTRLSSYVMRSFTGATWWTRTRAANMTYHASSSATAKTSMKISGTVHPLMSQLRRGTVWFISQISNLSDAYCILSHYTCCDLIILARYIQYIIEELPEERKNLHLLSQYYLQLIERIKLQLSAACFLLYSCCFV